MATIKLKRVSKAFGDFFAVKDFSVTAEDGEFLSFLGPSGCGKTTVLRCIAGFIPVTSGEIYIGDRLVSSSEKKILVPPEKRKLGMVFQSYAVWPHMNVFRNVAYPARIQKLAHKDILEKVKRILTMVHLEDYATRYPHQLSGGQQQRVALARALVMSPEALLLDEPLSNLDAKLRERMRFEIKELQERIKATIIYVTHDQAEAMAMSERIAVMEGGRIHQIGTPKEIYSEPRNRFVADFIGVANLVECLIVENRNNGRGVVRLLDGTGKNLVECSMSKGKKQGKGVLSIRPEHTHLSREKKGICGIVRKNVYLGKNVHYQIEVGNIRLRVESSGDVFYREGEEVFMTVERALLLEEDSSMRK
jgi:iron(III) transport system ATP-binding protein